MSPFDHRFCWDGTSRKEVFLKTNARDRKRIFRLFARGFLPEHVAELFAGSPERGGNSHITLAQVERLFEDYLMLPVWEKLRLTLIPESALHGLNRLIDDICDLKRLDDALDRTDHGMMVSLLDLKRKIKERMVKECSLGVDQSSGLTDMNDDEFDRLCEEIFEHPPSAE